MIWKNSLKKNLIFGKFYNILHEKVVLNKYKVLLKL
jgi:hypothetical protein